MSIAVCIATMNRFSFLKESIPKYLANPYVNELIIVDETGEDYAAITSMFSHPKLRVYKNEERLGIPHNKIRAMSYATSDYIAIMDSDNFADVNYFGAFRAFTSSNPYSVNSSVFLPSFAKPNFKYHQFIGKPMTKENVKQFWPNNETCLNTMNLIIPRAFFSRFNIMADKPMCDEVGCYDAIYFSLYSLFEMDATLYVVPGMEYEHRVHPGSSWLTTHEQYDDAYKRLLKRYSFA